MRNELNQEWLMQRLTRLQRVSDKQANIVVVEDMPTMRLLLVQTIKQMGFTNVHRAANGKQGLELIRQHKCDIAIVDWVMPHMTGLELLEIVRDDDELNDMIFIMVTAESHEVNIVRGVEERVDSYLTKPVNMYKLTRRLDDILHRREMETRCALDFSNGETKKALQKMGEMVKENPHAKWPLANLAKMYARLGQFDMAERYFEQILKKDSSTTYVLIELGKIKEKAGDVDAALKYYHRAIYRNNRFFRAYDVIADTLLSQGNSEDALLALETAMQNGGTESASRQKVFADLLIKENRYQEAEEALRKSLDLKPGQDATSKRFEIAKCCMAQGKVDDSIEVLEQVIKSAKKGNADQRLEASLMVGKSYLLTDQKAKAKKVFERLCEPYTWPGRHMPEAKYNILKAEGKVCLQAGDIHDASKLFFESAMLNLEDSNNINEITEYASSLGFPELSDAIAEKTTKIRRKIEEYAAKGRALAEKGEYSLAQDAYDQGLKLDPNSGRLYFNKGRLFSRMGLTEKCFLYIERALEFGLANWDMELICKVGELYIAQKNPKRALSILELAREVNHKDPRLEVLAALVGRIPDNLNQAVKH